jgi:hypothetical protein
MRGNTHRFLRKVWASWLRPPLAEAGLVVRCRPSPPALRVLIMFLALNVMTKALKRVNIKWILKYRANFCVGVALVNTEMTVENPYELVHFGHDDDENM